MRSCLARSDTLVASGAGRQRSRQSERTRWVVIWLLAAAALSGGRARAGDDPDPQAKALLERCLESQRRTEWASWHVRVDSSYQPRERSTPTRYDALIRRDHDRVDITWQYESLDKAKKTPPNRSKAVINDKGVYAMYGLLGKKPGLPDRATVYRDPQKYADNLSPLAADYCGGPLDGYAGRNPKRIVEHLLEAGTGQLVGQETIEGTACKIVRGHTPFGTIELAIDERKDCLPLRASCDKGPDDLAEDGKTRTAETTISLRPGEKVTRTLLLLDRVELVKVEGSYVTRAGRWKWTTYFADGSQLVLEDICKRWDIKLHPDFKATDAFKIELAEGATVDVPYERDSGIVYKWHKGDVVPAYAELTGGPDRFSRGRAWWTVVLWAGLGLALLVVAGGVLLRLKRQGQGA